MNSLIAAYGFSVFANTAILAPIEANFLPIPNPIPLEAPVITTFLFLKSSIYFSNTKIFIKKAHQINGELLIIFNKPFYLIGGAY